MRLIRPADAFLPLAFLIAALMGRDALAEHTFMAYMAVKLLGLASSNGVRAAFATQPSIRSVRGSVRAALLLQIMAGLLLTGICVLIGHTATAYAIALLLTAVLLNIEQVFYEYLYAIGDGGSALMCRLITAVLVATGMLVAAPAGFDHPREPQLLWLAGAATLAALVSIVIGLAIGGPLKGKLNAQVVKCAPRAMLHSSFYCLAGYAAYRYRPFGGPDTFFTFFFGLIVYELCRTPFRRSAMESRGMNRALLVVIGISIAAMLAWLPNGILVTGLGPLAFARRFLEDVPLAAVMTIVGCACAFIMFGNVRRREE